VIVLDSSFRSGFTTQMTRTCSGQRSYGERFLAGEWGKGLLLEYTATATTAELQICRTRR
jgi:hypothetical protein